MFAHQYDNAILLLYSLILGCALGVFYDLLRLITGLRPYISNCSKPVMKRLPATEKDAERAMFGFEKSIRISDVVSFFTDVIFFTVSAFAVIILLFHLSYGRIRVFSLVSAVAGFTVYRLTVGRTIMLVLNKILGYVKRMVKRVLIKILAPPIRLIKRPIMSISDRISRRSVRKKARKALRIMEEKELARIAKRLRENERNKSVGADG